MDLETAIRVFRGVSHTSSQVALHSEWHHDAEVCFVKIDCDRPLDPHALMAIGTSAALHGAASVWVQGHSLVIC